MAPSARRPLTGRSGTEDYARAPLQPAAARTVELAEEDTLRQASSSGAAVCSMKAEHVTCQPRDRRGRKQCVPGALLEQFLQAVPI